MKTKTLYTCEHCRTDYNSKQKAKNCETTHKTELHIADMRFLPFSVDSKGFPVSITVRDDKGNEVIYKR